MMTASCLSEYERAVREAGALALVEKPFDYDDLIRRFNERFGGPAAPAHPVGPK